MTGDALPILSKTTFDIHLNERAVWRYKLGGCQVLKKWLFYRERVVLDRPLKPEEVRYFMDATRRIAALPTGNREE